MSPVLTVSFVIYDEKHKCLIPTRCFAVIYTFNLVPQNSVSDIEGRVMQC